ncbi:MAG: hypothetical protein PVJ07_09695 [Anaerolineales bacterium]|jgi:hypothetical protein
MAVSIAEGGVLSTQPRKGATLLSAPAALAHQLLSARASAFPSAQVQKAQFG